MLKPLGDKVIVKQSEAEVKTKSGIVLPDSAQDKPNQGEIVAVGPGKRLDDGKVASMDLKVGDLIVYSSYAGTKFKLDGEELLIISESDILAKY
jgi:chaperonin GroES